MTDIREWYRGAWGVALVFAALAVSHGAPLGAWARFTAAPVLAPAQQTVVLKGCLERDAASSTPVFRLVVSAGGGSKLYRLLPSSGIDLAAHVGHTVEITGTTTPPNSNDRGGHAEPDVTVKKLVLVSNGC